MSDWKPGTVQCKPTDDPFGAELRRRRAEHNLSQSDLARRIGDGPTGTISRIESGQRNPSFAMVVAIADALDLTGYDRAWFLSLAGYTEQTWTRAAWHAQTLAVRMAEAQRPEGRAA